MDAVAKLSALAQPTRLEIFLAIARAANGITSSEVAEQTGHDAQQHFGAPVGVAERGAGFFDEGGRSVTYRAERGAVQRLATFLSEAAK